MTQLLWIPGPLPAFNDILRACGGKKRGYTAMKRTWVSAVAMRARAARLAPMKRVHLDFQWIERDRRRDPDNVAAAKKWINDGLVAAGVLTDDGWDEIAGWTDRWSVSKINPGVAVTMTEVP